MLKDGFLRFCDDPEIACCRGEAELGQLRQENIRLRAELLESQRRESAAVECIEEIEFSLANSRFSAAWAEIRKWRGAKGGAE